MWCTNERPLDEGRKWFLEPRVPVNVGKQVGKDVPKVQLNFNVKSVSGIDEVMFEFQAVVSIVMHWSDENIWASCRANGEDIEEGRCQYVWKPKLLFPNARSIDIPTARKYLWWGHLRAKITPSRDNTTTSGYALFPQSNVRTLTLQHCDT